MSDAGLTGVLDHRPEGIPLRSFRFCQLGSEFLV